MESRLPVHKRLEGGQLERPWLGLGSRRLRRQLVALVVVVAPDGVDDRFEPGLAEGADWLDARPLEQAREAELVQARVSVRHVLQLPQTDGAAGLGGGGTADILLSHGRPRLLLLLLLDGLPRASLWIRGRPSVQQQRSGRARIGLGRRRRHLDQEGEGRKVSQGQIYV